MRLVGIVDWVEFYILFLVYIQGMVLSIIIISSSSISVVIIIVVVVVVVVVVVWGGGEINT